MIEMTLSSRHRIRNSSPGGLRPSTLPLGHGGSPQYWLSHVDGEDTFLFLSNRRVREPNPELWRDIGPYSKLLICPWRDSTQDSKFEPWRSEAEHATSRSRRLPAMLTFTRGWGRNIFVSFKPPSPGTEPRTLAWHRTIFKILDLPLER